jgi:hypothetical protein
VYLRQNWLAPPAGPCVSADCKIGGEPKEKWMIGVYLVGRDGSVLLDYFADAVRVHGRALNELKNSTNKKPEYLPPLQRTSDMIECARDTVSAARRNAICRLPRWARHFSPAGVLAV